MSSCCSTVGGPPKDLAVNSVCAGKGAICSLKSDLAVVNNLVVNESITINNVLVSTPPARLAALFTSNPPTSTPAGSTINGYQTTFLRNFVTIGGGTFQATVGGLYSATASVVFTSFSFNSLQVQLLVNNVPYGPPSGFIIDEDTSNGASTLNGTQLLNLAAGDTVALVYAGFPSPLDIYQVSFIVDQMA